MIDEIYNFKALNGFMLVWTRIIPRSWTFYEIAVLLIKNLGNMRKFLLIKEIYVDAFRNLGSFLIKNYLKVLAWFCFLLIFVASYALVFRMTTGFAFQ